MTATIILDYDGTLHDCVPIYAPAFRLSYAGLVEQGQMPPRAWEDSEVEKWLGLTSAEMWDSFAPHLTAEEKAAASLVIGKEMLRRIADGGAKLYDGAAEALDTLKAQGHRLVFLSNCRTPYMLAHQQAFLLSRWFDGFFCAEDYGWQPKTEIFSVIRQQFPAPYVVIGDRYKDMEVATAHDLPSIGCAYGYGTAEELAAASVIIRHPSEIPEAVSGLI